MTPIQNQNLKSEPQHNDACIFLVKIKVKYIFYHP